MLPILLKIRLMTMAMAGWSASASPVPMPAEAFVQIFETRSATPVQVKLWDENLNVGATVLIDHEGNSDEATTAEIRHLFRCRFTNRERAIARRTLVMLADIAEKYEGKTIEFVSVYRTQKGESKTSPHRAGRAIDFRIRGEKLREIRDYLWRKYTEVGIGWYPSEQFIHMDTRPTLHDTSWTFLKGRNHYSPHWADVARRPQSTEQLPQARRPGV
ncbi:MAG: YcbK family protein [Kofleriaceae bacterium]